LFAWIVLAALVSAVVNILFGMSEFGGFDLSPLIDSGWRVAQGQIPNVDFICTFPPSSYLLTALAFKAFGVHWLSILLAEEVLYLLLCFLGLRLCWILVSAQTDNRPNSLAWLYVGAQTVVLLSVNHLWHSTTASGFAAYAILATYTLLRLPSSRHRVEVTAHIAFAFSVLLLSKPNTGWPATLLCLLCLLWVRSSALYASIALGTAALADTLALAGFHMRIADMLRGYSGLSGRAIPRLFLVGIHPTRSRAGEITVALTYLLLAIPAFRIIQIAWKNKSHLQDSPADFVCFAAGLISLIGLGTNWDIKAVDVPPFLVGAALLATMHAKRYLRVLPAVQTSVAVFCLFAVVVGFERLRMRSDGPWAGSSYGRTVRIHDRFFGDFKTHASFAALLKEVDGVVSSSRDKRIFFGPRMEFLYARENLASPLYLPLWWHPGTSYPLDQEANVEKNWLNDNFDVLIFAKNDRNLFPGNFFPSNLELAVDTHYKLNSSLDAIDVYYRSDLHLPQAAGKR
jgi:hypothetical protein